MAQQHDDIDDDAGAFIPDHPGVRVDAYHFARGAAAVLAACGETPTLQLEYFDGEGILIVGTDQYDVLRTWIPLPASGGWKDTEDVSGDAPSLNEKPDLIVNATLTEYASKILTIHAKVKRAKDNPKEHLTIEWGQRPDGAQQTLGGDLAPRAVRFSTPEGTAVCSDPQESFDWRTYAADVEAFDARTRTVGGQIGIDGARAIAYGRIGQALGVDRRFIIGLATVDDRRFITVQVPGFPYVQGFGIEAV